MKIKIEKKVPKTKKINTVILPFCRQDNVYKRLKTGPRPISPAQFLMNEKVNYAI